MILFVAVCLVQISYAQNDNKESDEPITVKGKVFNQEGKPVAGAIFYIDNIKTSFKSLDNGYFKIKVSPSSRNLKVISPQYGFSETLIEGRTTINFTLDGMSTSQNNNQDKSESGNKINLGYGSGDQKNLTTSVNKIDGENDRYSSYTDIYQMISGTVPGVQVSGKSITIRGRNSFSLSGEPLFVVDDIVVTSIDEIDPKRVSSIEILKDASASIYGSRAANGVILIRMKGSAGNIK